MTLTTQDIEAIKTLHLREKRVQMALAGFLTNAIREFTKGDVYIAPHILTRAISDLARAVPTDVEEAAAILGWKRK